ncbi:MAG: hypothetical protein ABI685_08855, partial [Ferruginibacter sp.]
MDQQRSARAIYFNPCEIILIKLLLTRIKNGSLYKELSTSDLKDLSTEILNTWSFVDRLANSSNLRFYLQKNWPDEIVSYINNKIPGFSFNDYYESLTDDIILEFVNEGRYNDGRDLTKDDTFKIEDWAKSKVEEVFKPPHVNPVEALKPESITNKGFDFINKTFIESIKDQTQKPKPEDFYLAKRVENCQWYGIIKNWDCVRNNYQEFENKVLQSFNADINKKVVGIVYGAGGTGKSTFLRRLAKNLSDRQFKTVWVNDINAFISNDDEDIKEIFSEGYNYLVIIEDWYQLASDEAIASKLLTQLTRLPNIRIVIGDRVITNKKYLNYFYGSTDDYFELTPEDNDEILNKIKSILPEWEAAIDKIIPKSNKTSLYILLFVLAHSQAIDSENEFIYNLNDIDADFDSIVNSDIKKINKKCTGIARALYYWACVYENYKIKISKKSFLELAKSIESNVPEIINETTDLGKLINNYIYFDSEQINKKERLENMIFFNQDLLAERGLAKVKIPDDWTSFDDSEKRKLMLTIVEKGDDFSAAVIFDLFYRKEPQVFINDDEIIKLFDYSVKKKNFYWQYLKNICDFTFLNREEKIKKIIVLNDIVPLRNSFWGFAVRWIKKEFKPDEQKAYFEKLNYKEQPTIFSAYFILLNNNEKKITAEEILTTYQTSKTIFHNIINACLENTNSKQTAAKILAEYQIDKSISPHIICRCLNMTKDGKIATQILKNYQIGKSISPMIICLCLDITKTETETNTIATEILNDYRTGKPIDYQIICLCLDITKTETETKAIATEILKDYQTGNPIDYQIICLCLDITKTET